MPKISLEPRKTTWVKFTDEKAKMKIERKVRIHYYKSNILTNMNHNIDMKYLFSGLKSGKVIPASQLIIKENGIPVSITNTVVSLSPDKFASATTYDPFVEVSDKVSKVDKSNIKQKKMSKRLIERSWTENVTRVIKIDNKTGRRTSVEVSVFDNPADDILFISGTPKLDKSVPPERIWEIKLKKEQEKLITLKFKVTRKESITLPPDKVGKYKEYDEDMDEMDFNDEAEYEQAVQQANQPPNMG